jgi:hypothetical protein
VPGAPLIDYWVIGVDRNNTDNTKDIIQKHLGKVILILM